MLDVCEGDSLKEIPVLLSPAQTLIWPIPSREGVHGDVMMLLLKYNNIFDKLFFKNQTKTLLFFLLLAFFTV